VHYNELHVKKKNSNMPVFFVLFLIAEYDSPYTPCSVTINSI